MNTGINFRQKDSKRTRRTLHSTPLLSSESAVASKDWFARVFEHRGKRRDQRGLVEAMISVDINE